MCTDITLGRKCSTQNCSVRHSNSAPYTTNTCGQYSVVSIATRYGLDGPEIETRWMCNFLYPSRPAPSPTQPPVQRVSGLFHGGKAAADHLACYRIASQQKHVQSKSTRSTIWKPAFNAFKRTDKDRAIPVEAPRVPGGWCSQLSQQSAHEGSKVVSPTNRAPLLPCPFKILILPLSQYNQSI